MIVIVGGASDFTQVTMIIIVIFAFTLILHVAFTACYLLHYIHELARVEILFQKNISRVCDKHVM